MRSRFGGELLLVVAPVVVVLAPLPLAYDNVLLLNFVVFLVLAQGLNLTYGFCGYLPFGYVGSFGAGAYGFAMLVKLAAVPPVLAVAGVRPLPPVPPPRSRP